MIVACLKWVDQRPEVDSTGHSTPDARFGGVSAADQAALEWALRCRDAQASQASQASQTVLAVTVGPPAAQAVLLDAMAVGADSALRIDAPFDTTSRVVAQLIAAQITDATYVFCGDYSFDRGTGSVPAFLAAELGCAQALGLVAITIGETGDGVAAAADRADSADSAGAGIGALRRVDGGRRDRLAITAPAVLSVEGSTATLRRASLRSLLAKHQVDTFVPPTVADPQPIGTSRPFRPRPRVLVAPAAASALERVKALTASGTKAAHGDPITLDPRAAADRILAALADWDYLT